MARMDPHSDLRMAYAQDSDVSTLELDSRLVEDALLAASSPQPIVDLLARLRRSSDEWLTTVNVLDELIFMVDRDGFVLRANRVLEQWGLGSIESALDCSLHDLVHPLCDDQNCYLMRGLHAVAESHEPGMKLRGIEVEDTQLGRFLEVGWHRIPDLNRSVNRSFAVVVFRDVTELHKQRMRLWQQNQDETMDHLARGLAHEIGNPLAGVKTSLQVLASHYESFDEEKKRVYLERILDGTERIWAIVNRVLHRGIHLGRLQTVQTALAFDHLQNIFVDSARASGVTLDFKDEPGLTIHAEPAAVDEILANVLTNAVEACSDGDQVTVTAQARDDEVLVAVRDTGCGIRPCDLGRVFQPFFTTKRRGTGIGMARVAFLMRSMGGYIEVNSSEGVGTEVFLTFQSGQGR